MVFLFWALIIHIPLLGAAHAPAYQHFEIPTIMKLWGQFPPTHDLPVHPFEKTLQDRGVQLKPLNVQQRKSEPEQRIAQLRKEGEAFAPWQPTHTPPGIYRIGENGLTPISQRTTSQFEDYTSQKSKVLVVDAIILALYPHYSSYILKSLS